MFQKALRRDEKAVIDAAFYLGYNIVMNNKMEVAVDLKANVFTIGEIRDVIREIAQRYGVERVTLFGSYARGEARSDSDIDLLIDKGRIRGIFQLSGFHLDLEERLNIHLE